MFLCPDCYKEREYIYSEFPLSKVGTCDKCGVFRYVERVYEREIKKGVQLDLFKEY